MNRYRVVTGQSINRPNGNFFVVNEANEVVGEGALPQLGFPLRKLAQGWKKRLETQTPQPPTAKGYFDLRAICPEVMVSCNVMGAAFASKEDEEWFIGHAETRMRWMHANNKVWRRKMERESNNDRDFLIVFIAHWLAAFLQDPDTFKRRHTVEVTLGLTEGRRWEEVYNAE